MMHNTMSYEFDRLKATKAIYRKRGVNISSLNVRHGRENYSILSISSMIFLIGFFPKHSTHFSKRCKTSIILEYFSLFSFFSIA